MEIIFNISLLLLLGILAYRRLFRVFPIFTAFVAWQLFSDLLMTASTHFFRHQYVRIYYSLAILDYLLELAILVEIAANVLKPAKNILPSWTLYCLTGIMAFIACGSFFVAAWINPQPFTGLRIFLVMDTTAAIVALVTFLLIAGSSQLLGLSWKNHVLQLATGLAFFSILAVLVELAQSQLHRGSSYADYNAKFQFWSHVQVIGYLCTLYFWCYAFVKKEAPRKEFSPQMARILVSLSGSTQRQRAVLARSRDA